MRAVVQRVARASVFVDSRAVSGVGAGLLVLLGVAEDDTEAEAKWLAHKVANLRIFADAEGKMNLSVKDVRGEVLVVSQFTLIANTRKGFRPSFVSAAPPLVAAPLVSCFVAGLEAEDVPVQSGVFGAHMQVDLLNDGPVTIVLEKGPGAG
ncbi:MAG: D-aminoacyl-tRNA deacylase [Anaerolineae bacterium]|jgi:D-tyrosyl-tRNA(Tyr) deacylase|nr:D-aminoacyl-tRNA deacylase [Anaerolineae bacterium]